MHHHPSLNEVLEERCSYEWMEVDVRGVFLGDFADSENEKGAISSPSFHIISGPVNSEYGTLSFQKATINIECVEENELQNLIGEKPLGAVNYYDEKQAFVTLRLSSRLYSNLLTFVSSNLKNLRIRIAVPVWEDKDVKCLPLIKYQVMYQHEPVWAE